MIERIFTKYSVLILLMLLICIVGIILLIMPLILKLRKTNSKEANSTGLTDAEIKKLDNTIDQEYIKKEAFDLYKKTEVAKTKFDYDTLKETLTDNLYKEEEQKLKQLKENKQKLVATNIKLQEIQILSIQKQEDLELINIYLHVSQYDYLINNKKKVERGTDDTEYQIEYKITLEKKLNKYFKIKKKECTGKWIINK